MLVDEVTITLHAGSGGNGAVAFQKVRRAKGPTGADGGNGASIYFEGVSDIGALAPLASRRLIEAENGMNGRGQFIDGRRGEEMTIKVPTGTTIRNTETGLQAEITKVGERLLAVAGGKGGRGNFKFRASTNTTPMEAEMGEQGDIATYELQLRLIADVGFIGLPNAGKSSLLNELTAAKSKVGSYAFTTLEPNLGAFYGLIIADIPGLIEGASIGKGLGIKFLKHIERTRVLFHLVSAESEDVVRDYMAVRSELFAYNPTLGEKKEIVFLTKSDMLSSDELHTILKTLKNSNIDAIAISILEPSSLELVRKALQKLQS